MFLIHPMDKGLDSIAEMGASLWGELSAGRYLGPTVLEWWRERHLNVLGIKGQACRLIPAFHCILGNIHWIIEKAREFQKNIYFCFIDYAKAFDYVDHNKLWKILKEMAVPDHLTCLSAYREICMQVRKQQLELDMEQQTGSK